MKIKKSTKALAAAASLAMMATVGLSACGGSSNDAKTTADGKVKITMWQDSRVHRQRLQQVPG